MDGRVLRSFVLACLCAGALGGMPIQAAIYVDAGATGTGDGSSWQNAFPYLQDALAAAATATKPVEIRVAQGAYRPDQGAGRTPGDRTAAFQLLNGVTLKGGYAGAGAPDPDARDVALYETILNGDLGGNDGADRQSRHDNSCHVVTADGTDETAVLDGFTVTAGYSMPSGFEWPHHDGPGMWIGAACPRVLNCRFVGNSDPGFGGALLVDRGSRPGFVDCAFLDNDAAGMSVYEDGNPVLTNCRFEGNAHVGCDITGGDPEITGCLFIGNKGRAISAWDCNLVLTNCVFERNQEGVHCMNHDLTMADCTFIGQAHGSADTGSGDLTARDCIFRDNTGGFCGGVSGGRVELYDCEFTGNSGTLAGAVYVARDKLIAIRCLFAGNFSAKHVGAISGGGGVVRLLNCTFVGNRGRPDVLERYDNVPAAPVDLTGCIVWNGPDPFQRGSYPAPEVTVRYSDVQGGYAGTGNIDVDPCFAKPGYWGDPNDPGIELGPENANAVWVAGDYHLKSQASHWDSAGETWVRDEVTSACIDAGDPNAPLGIEPFPNGGWLNLGAYGGSAQASKSYFGEPVCETQMPGDINGDCKVDSLDQAILLSHWLMEGTPVVNTPPTIRLIAPEEGTAVYGSAPVSLRAEATDVDGIVIKVGFTMEYYNEDSSGSHSGATGKVDRDGSDGWGCELKWSVIAPPDGSTCTIRAEAMDDRGATTAATPIQVAYHATK